MTWGHIIKIYHKLCLHVVGAGPTDRWTVQYSHIVRFACTYIVDSLSFEYILFISDVGTEYILLLTPPQHDIFEINGNLFHCTSKRDKEREREKKLEEIETF